MVEIYLHPEIEAMWVENADASQPQPSPSLEAVATATQLLQDVRLIPMVATRHTVGHAAAADVCVGGLHGRCESVVPCCACCYKVPFVAAC